MQSRRVCVFLLGLWSGLIIGYITDYYTSFEHDPVKELTQACTTGAAPIIYGMPFPFSFVHIESNLTNL